MSQKHKKGFTLIELLVVISIISLLSSIVLTTLNGARAKARDAVIKQELNEMTKIMALYYSDNTTYCGLQPFWILKSSNCDSFVVSDAVNICKKILESTDIKKGDYRFFAGIHDPPYSCLNYYSFMAQLSNGSWYCAGSSGSKGEYPGFNGSPGCYNNP
jgi:prepilin-type N-terminal cleavage/methylation domain-containing protein